MKTIAPCWLGVTLAVVMVLLITPAAHAVRLDQDGQGQALIYPYYTVQTVNGDPLNTYISIVNTTFSQKIVRVRFRESRAGAEVLSFNLFLTPNDVWTGALVPSNVGATLVSADLSCTSPAFTTDAAPGAIPATQLSSAAFSGANDDGDGTGPERVREGFVEVLEMATLADVGGSAAACAADRNGQPVSTAPPTGGLEGGETLINVANGTEFPMNAVALADLSTRPFYRKASDPYPDFNAAEIDPVSVVVDANTLYRSVWSRPVDAVSATLMRSGWRGEFVLDFATASQTDMVITFPTRRFYAFGASLQPPFSGTTGWSPACGYGVPSHGTTFSYVAFNREGGDYDPTNFPFSPLAESPTLCATANAFPVMRAVPTPATTSVLGSVTDGLSFLGYAPVYQLWENGWLYAYTFAPAMTSGASSMRYDLATGTTYSGSHVLSGLPLVGFTVRTFSNGTLLCGAGSCQGNYGGAFPLRYVRTIAPAP